MTVTTVTGPKGRLSPERRRRLAETLTDAALVPEVGQFAPAARVGFQVHFTEREADMMAISGRLLADAGPEADAMVIDVTVMDVTVMDGDWSQEVRTEVIQRALVAMPDACGLAEPSPAWWVTFRVIDEGSWGSRGTVLSVLSLLDSGVFTAEKAEAVRTALGA
ncbi:tautomerase enzyme [Streptomyces hawaiiensis]|uniref:tautomerase enzyme n=1 Tax=Streptomyces hawaiiensis TaxID=67305 RepID=UPI00365E2A68